MEVPESMFNLGLMYNEGRGVARNPKKAYSYFHLAALKGHLRARFMIGYMHYKGSAPVGKNCDKAVRQFKEVAERGVWNRVLALGLRSYEKGEYGNALYRYLQAAHAGIEVAQYNAAFCMTAISSGTKAASQRRGPPKRRRAPRRRGSARLLKHWSCTK